MVRLTGREIRYIISEVLELSLIILWPKSHYL